MAVGLSVVLYQAKRQTRHPRGHAARDASSRSALSWWHSTARHGAPAAWGPDGAALTSAWPPGVSVLLQRSQRRQGRCQSFPSEVTFSAAAGTSRDGHPHRSPTRRGWPECPTGTSPPCIQTPDPPLLDPPCPRGPVEPTHRPAPARSLTEVDPLAAARAHVGLPGEGGDAGGWKTRGHKCGTPRPAPS